VQKALKRVQALIMSPNLWGGIVLLGIILRVYQYQRNRSLWADEASLAVNLVERSFSGLTQLLDYHQAAPIGFLFIEKFFIVLLGNHDYVMRLFPLFAGILATYLIFRVARASFGIFGLFAVSIFSISWWLVYYSSELKQYSSDVMVALLLVWLAIKALRENAGAKDFLILGLGGVLVIWISHPSVFFLAGIGLALVLEKLTHKEFAPWVWILGIGAGWLASFGLEYLVSLRHIVVDEYLIEYWRRTYVPMPPWSDKRWFVDTYYSFLFFSFHRADNLVAVVTLILSVIGALTLLMRNWKTALLVISPFVMVVIVSALQRYPLKDRFMLFLIPFALLLMAEGFRGIYWLVAKWNSGIAGIVSGLLALFVVAQIVPVTYGRVTSNAVVNVRPVFVYVVVNRLPDDVVYVFNRTAPVFAYYAPLYGLDSGDVRIGTDSPRKREALQNFEDDVDSLAGTGRVWFIITEVSDCPNCAEEDTHAFYLKQFDKFGTLLGSYKSPGAGAYLYDLSQ